MVTLNLAKESNSINAHRHPVPNTTINLLITIQNLHDTQSGVLLIFISIHVTPMIWYFKTTISSVCTMWWLLIMHKSQQQAVPMDTRYRIQLSFMRPLLAMSVWNKQSTSKQWRRKLAKYFNFKTIQSDSSLKTKISSSSLQFWMCKLCNACGEKWNQDDDFADHVRLYHLTLCATNAKLAGWPTLRLPKIISLQAVRFRKRCDGTLKSRASVSV